MDKNWKIETLAIQAGYEPENCGLSDPGNRAGIA